MIPFHTGQWKWRAQNGRVEDPGIDDKKQITACICVEESCMLAKSTISSWSASIMYVLLTTGGMRTWWWDIYTVFCFCILRKFVSIKISFVIFDQLKGQTTNRFLQALEHNNIHVMEVPANCTNQFQPLDLSINKLLGSHTKNSLVVCCAGTEKLQWECKQCTATWSLAKCS